MSGGNLSLFEGEPTIIATGWRGLLARLRSLGKYPVTWVVLVLVCTGGLILSRICAQPIQPYGASGAHYIEHEERLLLVQKWRAGQFDSLPDFLIQADGMSYPPMLHLLTSCAGSVTGHAAEQVLWTGLVWFMLLALALAGVAWGLTRRRDMAAAAAVGTMLLPAVQGMAARYYFDLPMTAMTWMAVAALLTLWRRHPLVAGVASAACLVAATLIKYTAMPYGALMLVGALMCRMPGGQQRGRQLGRRLLVGAICAGLAGFFIGWFIINSGSFSDGTLVFGDPRPTGFLADQVQRLPGMFQLLARRVLVELSTLSLAKIAWYPMAFTFNIFSPALTLLVAPLIWVWLRRNRAGLPLVAMTVIPQLGFVTIGLLIRDERFAMTMAPALVLAAALGWGTLPRRRRRQVGAVALAAGLLVAADFHLSPRAPWNAPVVVYGGQGPLPAITARGPGASSSFEQRGWARRDAVIDAEAAWLEQLWSVMARCQSRFVANVADVSVAGGPFYLRYRAALSRLRGEGWVEEIMVLADYQLGGRAFWWPHPDNTHPDIYSIGGWRLDMLDEDSPGQASAWKDPEAMKALLEASRMPAQVLTRFRPPLMFVRSWSGMSGALHRDGWLPVGPLTDLTGEVRGWVHFHPTTPCRGPGARDRHGRAPGGEQETAH